MYGTSTHPLCQEGFRSPDPSGSTNLCGDTSLSSFLFSPLSLSLSLSLSKNSIDNVSNTNIYWAWRIQPITIPDPSAGFSTWEYMRGDPAGGKSTSYLSLLKPAAGGERNSVPLSSPIQNLCRWRWGKWGLEHTTTPVFWGSRILSTVPMNILTSATNSLCGIFENNSIIKRCLTTHENLCSYDMLNH